MMLLLGYLALFLGLSTAQIVTDLVLVDTVSQKDLDLLQDGDTINLSRVGHNLSIRAIVEGSGYVLFDLDQSKSIRIEDHAPYLLAGKSETEFYASNRLVRPGRHSIQVGPHNSAHIAEDRRLSESLNLSFTVVENAAFDDVFFKESAVEQEEEIVESETWLPSPTGTWYETVGGHTLLLAGPLASESSTTDPGLYRASAVAYDYRLDLNTTTPCYYAGSLPFYRATAGSTWVCHTSLQDSGLTYRLSFREGTNVAAHGGGDAAGFMDGVVGQVPLTATTDHANPSYVWGAATNFLAHAVFEEEEDPSSTAWSGAATVGRVLQYYQKQDMTAVRFRIIDDSVHPFLSDTLQPYWFDLSKLAQWTVAVEDCYRRGLVVVVEIPNDWTEDREAKTVLMRELVARWGHFSHVQWDTDTTNWPSLKAATPMTVVSSVAEVSLAVSFKGHPVWADGLDVVQSVQSAVEFRETISQDSIRKYVVAGAKAVFDDLLNDVIYQITWVDPADQDVSVDGGTTTGDDWDEPPDSLHDWILRLDRLISP